MTETLQGLAAAGAVQDALYPLGDLLPRPLGCGLVAGLPVLADADMQVGGFPVIDGGPASGALGLIHAPIIGSNKCVDKYSFEVFNVNTLNQEADMETAKLPRFSEIADMRCQEASNGTKTINIKVAINTARMMVEAEIEREKERKLLLAHLEFAVKLLSAFPAVSGTAQVERMRVTIAKARGESEQANSKETK